MVRLMLCHYFFLQERKKSNERVLRRVWRRLENTNGHNASRQRISTKKNHKRKSDVTMVSMDTIDDSTKGFPKGFFIINKGN